MCRISKMKCRPITNDDRHISNNDRICQPKKSGDFTNNQKFKLDLTNNKPLSKLS